jgi:hypothetical protein
MTIEWQLLIVAFLAVALNLFATNGDTAAMGSHAMEPRDPRHASCQTEDRTAVATRR